MKTCTKCNEVKTLDCFSKRSDSKSGFVSHCKKCYKIYSIKYRADNPEKINARNNQYRNKNKEKLNSDKKQARLANPEKSREYASARRARKLSNGVFKILPKEIIKLYASQCIYCGSSEQIQADHVIPIIKGGTHSIGNLVPACQKCNYSKGIKLLIEWKSA